MSNDIVQLLKKIGLSKRQAQIYVALLEIGKGSVQEIADQSGLKRTSIYPNLEVLKDRGVLFESKIDAHTYYLPEDPEQLVSTLKDQAEELSQALNSLSEPSKKQRSHVQFYTGSDGFKKIWSAIFSSDVTEYLIITDAREFNGFVQNKYIEHSIIKRKVEKGIHSRQIIAFSEDAKNIIAKDGEENRESKILPHQHKIPYTTIVFGNKVALISPMPENIIMIIESESYTRTQRSFFEALWESIE